MSALRYFCLLTLRVQIADFGFAAIGESPMLCQSIVGSKTYMAPEVLGRRSYTFPPGSAGYEGALVSPSLTTKAVGRQDSATNITSR